MWPMAKRWGKFGPGDPITREQLGGMLYRYEEYRGGGFTGAEAVSS